MDDEQLAWLQTLVTPALSPLLFVFGHHPLFDTTTKSDQPMMYVENSDAFAATVSALATRVLYFNGHNHEQSIAERNAYPGWSFVQSTSVLSEPCYRLVECTSTDIRIDTQVVEMDQMQETLARIHAAVPDYWHHVTTTGTVGDWATILNLDVVNPRV